MPVEGRDLSSRRTCDPTAGISGIVAAAAQRGLPLAVLDMRSPEASLLYRHKLVLVRPDQHVAWRGDAEPANPLDLVDLVRGAPRGRRWQNRRERRSTFFDEAARRGHASASSHPHLDRGNAGT